jgi:hypothetical protein
VKSEAQIVIDSSRRQLKSGRAPKVFVQALAAWPVAQSRPAPPIMLSLVPRRT